MPAFGNGSNPPLQEHLVRPSQQSLISSASSSSWNSISRLHEPSGTGVDKNLPEVQKDLPEVQKDLPEVQKDLPELPRERPSFSNSFPLPVNRTGKAPRSPKSPPKRRPTALQNGIPIDGGSLVQAAARDSRDLTNRPSRGQEDGDIKDVEKLASAVQGKQDGLGALGVGPWKVRLPPSPSSSSATSSNTSTMANFTPELANNLPISRSSPFSSSPNFDAYHRRQISSSTNHSSANHSRQISSTSSLSVSATSEGGDNAVTNSAVNHPELLPGRQTPVSVKSSKSRGSSKRSRRKRSTSVSSSATGGTGTTSSIARGRALAQPEPAAAWFTEPLIQPRGSSMGWHDPDTTAHGGSPSTVRHPGIQSLAISDGTSTATGDVDFAGFGRVGAATLAGHVDPEELQGGQEVTDSESFHQASETAQPDAPQQSGTAEALEEMRQPSPNIAVGTEHLDPRWEPIETSIVVTQEGSRVHTSSEHDHESTSYRDSFLEEDGISEMDQDAARNSSYLTPTSSIYRLSSQSVPSRRASNLLHARPAHRTSFPRRSSQRLSHLSYQYSSSLKSTSSRTSVLSRSSFYSAPSVSEVYRKSRGSTSEYDEGDEEWEDAPDFDEWDLARESVDFSNPGSRKMSLDQEKVHQDLMASANTQEVLASRLRSSPERDDPLVSPDAVRHFPYDESETRTSLEVGTGLSSKDASFADPASPTSALTSTPTSATISSQTTEDTPISSLRSAEGSFDQDADVSSTRSTPSPFLQQYMPGFSPDDPESRLRLLQSNRYYIPPVLSHLDVRNTPPTTPRVSDLGDAKPNPHSKTFDTRRSSLSMKLGLSKANPLSSLFSERRESVSAPSSASESPGARTPDSNSTLSPSIGLASGKPSGVMPSEDTPTMGLGLHVEEKLSFPASGQPEELADEIWRQDLLESALGGGLSGLDGRQRLASTLHRPKVFKPAITRHSPAPWEEGGEDYASTTSGQGKLGIKRLLNADILPRPSLSLDRQSIDIPLEFLGTPTIHKSLSTPLESDTMLHDPSTSSKPSSVRLPPADYVDNFWALETLHSVGHGSLSTASSLRSARPELPVSDGSQSIDSHTATGPGLSGPFPTFQYGTPSVDLKAGQEAMQVSTSPSVASQRGASQGRGVGGRIPSTSTQTSGKGSPTLRFLGGVGNKIKAKALSRGSPSMQLPDPVPSRSMPDRVKSIESLRQNEGSETGSSLPAYPRSPHSARFTDNSSQLFPPVDGPDTPASPLSVTNFADAQTPAPSKDIVKLQDLLIRHQAEEREKWRNIAAAKGNTVRPRGTS